MDINYSECTVDENVGGIGFILRDGNGNVVRESHDVPLGFPTRDEGETWLRMAAMREQKARWEEVERQQDEAR